MKVNNPKSRYHLNIKKNHRVLEVGGGHNPHYRSNVIVDKFVDSNYHRHADIKVLDHQQFMQADGSSLPFEDHSFDYVICNQVLEHTEDPVAFLKEQMRVAKSGYLEVPSLIGEYLFPKKSHKWLILELDNKLIIMDKEKHWFNTGMDFGYLFLTWLQKTSIGYKIMMDTIPNFRTIRYEWRDEIEFVVNPGEAEYAKYFTQCWDEEMVKTFFPKRSNLEEFVDAARSFGQIFWRAMGGRHLSRRA
ncbi:MAG: class I SAM-dependent methyltransferase [Marinilabiliaceae bacterium]|nr:class I SAM-dependent methyltransferase [Marinilabiliaceae bacterium]